MEKFIAYIILAIAVEGSITYVNNFFVSKTPKWQQIVSLIIGELVAVGYNADLLNAFGLESKLAYLGIAITGIALSRGSNYVADFIKKILNVIQTGGSDIISLVVEEDEEGLG